MKYVLISHSCKLVKFFKTFQFDMLNVVHIDKNILYLNIWGTWWRSWLRHCATSQKVAGLISSDVTGIFHWHTPSSHSVAQGLTQSVKETGIFPWGYRWLHRADSLTHLCADCLIVYKPSLLEPSRPEIGPNKYYFTFYLNTISIISV